MTAVAAETLEDTRTRVTATFTPLGSTSPGDPTTVRFSVRSPAGAVVAYTYGVDAPVVRVATGVYYLDVIPTSKGTWWVQAYGSGATGINAKMEIAIKSDQSVFP